MDANLESKNKPLLIQGRASEHIWGMVHAEDGEVLIGLRFDSGDSGTIYMTPLQAHDTIDTLNDLLRQMV